MKIEYYLRYAWWIPRAFLKEFAYRFWLGNKSTYLWRDINGELIGPNMTEDEFDRWFKK